MICRFIGRYMSSEHMSRTLLITANMLIGWHKFWQPYYFNIQLFVKLHGMLNQNKLKAEHKNAYTCHLIDGRL